MEKKYKFLLIYLTLCLTNCSTVVGPNFPNLISTPTYQEPASKNAAFFNLTPIADKKITQVNLVFYNESYDCSGITEVSNSWVNNQNRPPLIIDANKEFTFGISYFPEPLIYCSFIASFKPITGQAYSVFINKQEHACHLIVNRLVGEKLIPLGLLQREGTVPRWENGPHCKPLN